MLTPISSRSNYATPRAPGSRVADLANRIAIEQMRIMMERLILDCCQSGFYGRLQIDISVEDGVLQPESLVGQESKRIKNGT